MNRDAAIRPFAVVATLGLIVTVIATVVGHVGLTGFDPLTLTISDYALSNRGASIEVAMVALAGGSLAVLAGLLAARAPARGVPSVLLSLWSLGLLIAAVIPTDPPGLPTMSTAALVHRYASVGAFVCLPLAAAVLARRFRTEPLWAGLRRRLWWFAGLSAVGLIGLWYVAFPGERVLMGLVERGLVGVEILLLATLTARLFTVAAIRAAAPVSPAVAYASSDRDRVGAR